MTEKPKNKLPAGPGRKKGAFHNYGLLELRKLTKKELSDVGGLMIKGDIDGLRKLSENTKAPALICIFAKILCRIYDEGDMHAFNVLLDRIIGRVQADQPVNPIGNDNGIVIVNLPSNGREVRNLSEPSIDVEARSVST
jgi:hypothetical protein